MVQTWLKVWEEFMSFIHFKFPLAYHYDEGWNLFIRVIMIMLRTIRGPSINRGCMDEVRHPFPKENTSNLIFILYTLVLKSLQPPSRYAYFIGHFFLHSSQPLPFYWLVFPFLSFLLSPFFLDWPCELQIFLILLCKAMYVSLCPTQKVCISKPICVFRKTKKHFKNWIPLTLCYSMGIRPVSISFTGKKKSVKTGIINIYIFIP